MPTIAKQTMMLSLEARERPPPPPPSPLVCLSAMRFHQQPLIFVEIGILGVLLHLAGQVIVQGSVAVDGGVVHALLLPRQEPLVHERQEVRLKLCLRDPCNSAGSAFQADFVFCAVLKHLWHICGT